MTGFRFSRIVLAMVVAVAGMTVALEQAQADTPSWTRLLRYHRTLGYKVLQFAKSQMGKQVGNGECWTLAHDALQAAGAKRPGQELAVYVFGTPVSLQDARAGDILQFENVRFVSPSGAWQSFGHHTAIVSGRSGNVIQLIHQNVNGNRTVQTGTINLAERQGGTIQAFRPVAR